jgi:hypothetical protein
LSGLKAGKEHKEEVDEDKTQDKEEILTRVGTN